MYFVYCRFGADTLYQVNRVHSCFWFARISFVFVLNMNGCWVILFHMKFKSFATVWFTSTSILCTNFVMYHIFILINFTIQSYHFFNQSCLLRSQERKKIVFYIYSYIYYYWNLHFFVQIWVSIWCHFPSACITSFSISFSTGLQEMSCFGFVYLNLSLFHVMRSQLFFSMYVVFPRAFSGFSHIFSFQQFEYDVL